VPTEQRHGLLAKARQVVRRDRLDTVPGDHRPTEEAIGRKAGQQRNPVCTRCTETDQEGIVGLPLRQMGLDIGTVCGHRAGAQLS
jgi:hypothetical protein